MKNRIASSWVGTQNTDAKSYQCGFCRNSVASNLGWYGHSALYQRIYICPLCNQPTYFYEKEQLPGVAFGSEVTHLPDDVSDLYNEARNCIANSHYTASVLICRKLLMNIAVSQGAKTGESFQKYVDYLADKGYIPPNGKAWVDHIRTKGNEANHEIVLMSLIDAQELVVFAEMLLKFIFEFPNRVPTT